jgi:exodeoxyribonuclease VII small subunit
MAKVKTPNPSVEDLLSSSDPASVLAQIPFEAGLALLEELVQKVESGSLPLDESLSAYESGNILVGKLKAILEAAEGRLVEVKK